MISNYSRPDRKTPEAPSRAKNLRSITTYCTDEARSKTPEPPPSTRKRRSVTTIPTEKKKNPENSMRSRTTSTLRSASVSSQAENSRNLDAIMQASTEPPLVIDEEPQTSIYDQEVDDLAEIRDIPDTRPTGTIIEGIEVYESNGRMVVRTTKPGRKRKTVQDGRTFPTTY
ncbi:unnamed protein product [Caenorhabditis auriculariae]|uniref:Uncharacterized protein n=1 Tax=Caenorhabditis auriculariae TaxID=2777116 RepID=A0A8S1GSG3_9PELO|nr:unnamed protein product [Caenorhabditis auriculariae]